MNIHHLELFYYVAKHGGISEAVRNIPYGIQQPAVSYQVIQLEEDLGVTLFRRRPFALTPAGEKLYQFVQPFFGQLGSVADELRGGVAQQLRLGASEVFLKDHLPDIFKSVRGKFPRLKLTLKDGYQPQLLKWVQEQEVDLVVSLVEKKLPAGLSSVPLLELPLVLWVEKGRKIASAEELWKQDKISEPLICLPVDELIPRSFQNLLSQIGVDWFPSIEVSTLALIETYVAHGFGIGLGVDLPKTQRHPNIRSLPLPGSPTIVVGAIWHGKINPLIQAFVDEMQRHVQLLKPQK